MIVLLPCYSLEDFSIYRSPEESNQIFSAFSAVYHPALIEAVGKMPEWERAGNPLTGRKRTLIVIPPCCETQIPREWLKEAESSGAAMVRHRENRDEIVAEALEKLGCVAHGFSDDAVESFYALGFCHLSAELLSRKLRYMSNLDSQNFTIKTLQAVKALRAGETREYEESIRRSFELLAESKTYFFPTATKLLDLTWLTRSTLGAPLDELLMRRRRRNELTNLALPTRYLEFMADEAPETLALLKEEIAAKRVTLAGGDLDEVPLYLLPPMEIVSRLLDGLLYYSKTLGARPAFFARNGAGFTPSLPTLLKGVGYEGGLFFTRDGQRPSRENQSRIDWSDRQGTLFPLLARPPLDAESDKCFMEMADRIGYGSNADRVQTSVFEHRPLAERPWLGDMARMDRFAHVLGESVTLADYFASSGRNGLKKEFELDDLRTNYLTRAGREGRPDPVSLWRDWYRVRAKMDRLAATALFAGLAGPKRSIAALDEFDRLERDAERLESWKERIESILFRPIALETAFDEEEPRRAAAERIADEMSKAAEQVRRDEREWNAAESETVNRPFAELLHSALAPARKDPNEPAGDFFANLTAVERTVPLQGERAVSPEARPFLKRVAGETLLTLPAFSTLWIPSAESNGTSEPISGEAPSQSATESGRQKRGGFFGRLAKRFERSEPERQEGITFRDEVFSDGTADRFYSIRNRFFELRVDETTGEVRSLRTFSAPSVRSGGGILRQPAMGNRFAWQIAFRLGESALGADVRPKENAAFGYTIMAAERVEILQSGPPLSVLRVSGTLCMPDGGRAATFVETISVREESRLIDVELTIRPTILPSENPWENYYGVRFAWNDALAEVSAGVGGTLWPTSRDFLQAPECVDIQSDRSIRLTLLTGGLPFHRRRQDRRLDTILIPKNESARTFRFGVGVDLPDPLSAAERFLAPEPFALERVRPTKRPFVSLLDVNPASVRVIGLEPLYRDDRPTTLRGFRLILQEKSGEKTTCRVTSRFALSGVRVTDLLGRPLESLPLENAQTLTLDLAPNAILPLEMTLTR